MNGSVDADLFPRGGRKPIPKNNQKRKKEDNLFTVEKPYESKKLRLEKQVKKATKDEAIWQKGLKFHGTLSYNKMQNGMVILACIKHVSNLAIQIEFPGVTFGQVTINRISDAFTNALAAQLKAEINKEPIGASNIFRPGHLMPVKLLAIETNEKGYNVQATLNPKDINSEKSHMQFKKGLTIWANVLSELDHGYELCVGVKNCRVFLPFKKINDSKKYITGEPLYCVIHKVECSNVATTLTVSARQEHLEKIQPIEDVTLFDVIPGMKVKFFVEEVIPQGIKGYVFEKCYGFIDQTQIYSRINVDRLKEGSTLSAYILYVEPITKVTYLTLRSLQNLPPPHHQIGNLLSAEVQSYVAGGLYLNLGDDATGFITNKRIVNTLGRSVELDFSKAIKIKYPIGSRHQCRVMDFNYMQQLYICTFEKQVLKEKVFTSKDMKLGQKVDVRIENILPNGFVVKCGYVQGFVPNLHISNNKYSENMKGKHAEGDIVSARVLSITEDKNVIFTLKKSLVEAEDCITTVENAKFGSRYAGFVVQTKVSGALIAFYGGIKGWISRQILNSGNDGADVDPRDYFFIGQVVHIFVNGYKNGKLQLSLNQQKNSKRKSLKVGARVNGTVTAIYDDRIIAEVGRDKFTAAIPVGHLSNCLPLARLLLKTFDVGMKIDKVICVKNHGDIPIVSRREQLVYESNGLKVPVFSDVEKGMMLRCSFEQYTDSGILVSTPIKDYHQDIPVKIQDIKLPGGLTYEKHEPIIAKVLDVNHEEPSIKLGISQITNKDIIDSFLQNVEDWNRIANYSREHGDKLTQFEIGQRVQCKVIQIKDKGECLVKLSNGVLGMVAPHLSTTQIEVGSVTEGVVLNYDFMENRIDFCLKKDICQKINKVQDGTMKAPLHSSCIGCIILHTKLYALGILKDAKCNRQLVYIPTEFLKNNPNVEEKKAKFKLLLHRRLGNKIIGLPKKLALALEPKKRFIAKQDGAYVKVTPKSEAIIEEIKEEVVEDESNPMTEVGAIDDVESDGDTRRNEEEDEIDDKETENIVKAPKLTGNCSILSGVGSFYAAADVDVKDVSSSEETEVESQSKKKKKLTPTERAELAKKKEERISKIENELSDLNMPPQTAEHFDRLLLANPNSSELWLKYMAMHVATTELEKARVIGKRALETISMTLVTEKFNIWIALLNLENMYGTRESFEKLFEDAVKYNDSLEVYLSVIKMLATSGKLSEMEEKIKKVRAKEKQNSKMWLDIGQVYYTLGKFREARNVKEAALKSIVDNKRQFDLIVKFGVMEFQVGEFEQAVANFETILNTFPAKVNIWILYADQLIKKKKIDDARNVLERAASQRLAVKSMKSIFQKFVAFEEQYGTETSLASVKERARDYVKAMSAK